MSEPNKRDKAWPTEVPTPPGLEPRIWHCPKCGIRVETKVSLITNDTDRPICVACNAEMAPGNPPIYRICTFEEMSNVIDWFEHVKWIAPAEAEVLRSNVELRKERSVTGSSTQWRPVANPPSFPDDVRKAGAEISFNFGKDCYETLIGAGIKPDKAIELIHEAVDRLRRSVKNMGGF